MKLSRAWIVFSSLILCFALSLLLPFTSVANYVASPTASTGYTVEAYVLNYFELPGAPIPAFVVLALVIMLAVAVANIFSATFLMKVISSVLTLLGLGYLAFVVIYTYHLLAGSSGLSFASSLGFYLSAIIFAALCITFIVTLFRKTPPRQPKPAE